MARVTQRVDPGALEVLLEQPPRAAIAYVDGDQIEAVPVAYCRYQGRHLVRVEQALEPGPTRERAVLLIDDGRYWFELRAVTLRGRLAPSPDASPGGAASAGVWLELVPEHVVAWDYATLHEEPEE